MSAGIAAADVENTVRTAFVSFLLLAQLALALFVFSFPPALPMHSVLLRLCANYLVRVVCRSVPA